MKKLSPVQTQTLETIRKSILEAKQCTTYEEYYNKESSNRYNYQEMILKFGQKEADTYKLYWKNKLKNITLTNCSSSTLKVLEKAGYIEIIVDGGNWTDTVKLLNVE